MAISFAELFVVPGVAGSFNLFWTWNFTNNKTENNVSYFFRHETKNDLSYNTVRGVAIRYVNVGPCSLTVTLAGMFVTLSKNLVLGQTDPTGTGDAIKNKQYYGAPPPLAVADGQSYTAFFYFGVEFTDEDFQVQLSMVGDGNNQFVIEQVSVIGDGQEISR